MPGITSKLVSEFDSRHPLKTKVPICFPDGCENFGQDVRVLSKRLQSTAGQDWRSGETMKLD